MHFSSTPSSSSSSTQQTKSNSAAAAAAAAAAANHFRLAPIVATTNAIPICDKIMETTLRKELIRRRETTVSTLLYTTIGILIIILWVLISSWMCFEQDMIFTILHRGTADVQVWLVTEGGQWKEPTPEQKSISVLGMQQEFVSTLDPQNPMGGSNTDGSSTGGGQCNGEDADDSLMCQN